MRFALGVAAACLVALGWLGDCTVGRQPAVSAQEPDSPPVPRCISAVWDDGAGIQGPFFQCWYVVFGLASDG